MDLREAMDIVGLSNVNEPLPTNRKMPGPSYDLPASACRMGSILAANPGSMCHAKVCYAKRGWFRAPWVREGLERRLASIGRPGWARAFAFILRERYATTRHFRWHASGDLQSADHLRDIVKVARLAPWMKFWLPSHEASLVNRVLARAKLPENLTIRISADYLYSLPDFDRTHRVRGKVTWSTVHEVYGSPLPAPGRRVFECRAHDRGNECGPCRACWSRNATVVSYPRTTPKGVIRSNQLRIIP